MNSIKVNLKKTADNSYDIFIGKSAVQTLPALLKKHKGINKYAIITDDKVLKIHGRAFAKMLRGHRIECEIFSVGHGETAKNLQTVENLAGKLLEKNFDRKDAIIALGGGVVGDIAGFLAGIYMRGIPYIQVPTTLLAMVDSSIGGKTGVNLKEGKNLIGEFHQPLAVFIDPDFLKTLPVNQIKNGLAEVIKCAVIKDKKLFTFLEQNCQKILALDQSALNKIITQTVKIKKEFVEKDEQENGLRMFLNYGHTFGHQIEKLSNYKLLHGYAISIGMVKANKFAVEKDFLDQEDADRIKKLLTIYDLPVITTKKITLNDLASDKKKSGNIINLILPIDIGEAVIFQQKINHA